MVTVFSFHHMTSENQEYVFNFGLFEFSAAILEKGLLLKNNRRKVEKLSKILRLLEEL